MSKAVEEILKNHNNALISLRGKAQVLGEITEGGMSGLNQRTITQLHQLVVGCRSIALTQTLKEYSKESTSIEKGVTIYDDFLKQNLSKTFLGKE